MSLIDTLVSIVSPPSSPIAAVGDWAMVEADLGLELPGDYKDLISLYGDGYFVTHRFRDLLGIESPFGKQVSPRQFWKTWVDVYRQSEYGIEVPFPLFPDIPGLLPCASYRDSDRLNWLTHESPTAWKLIFWSNGSVKFSDLGRVSLTQFVIDLCSESKLLPRGTLRPDSKVSFVSREHPSGP